VYDADLIEKSSYYVREASTAYLLSQLLDCLFSVCLAGMEQNRVSADSSSPDPTPELLSKIISTLACTSNERSVPSSADKDLSYSSQMTNTAPDLTAWLRTGEVTAVGDSDSGCTDKASTAMFNLSSVFETLVDGSDEETLKRHHTRVTR
jgi:hypothetical protein